MFWADKLLEERGEKEIINDSWTPSGEVHMGSLKGPIIHNTLYKILKSKGSDARFMYGIDDADHIDGLPIELIESHSKYLGTPLHLVPSPSGEGTFGDYFGNKMKAILTKLDVGAEFYKTSEIYKNGEFNDAIKYVLEHAEEIRAVYKKIYKKEIAKDWYPLQVVCPNCGKLGTTKVTNWDGKEVSFSCEPDLVRWAQGCGEKGKIDPLGGNSKMPWKVEWAAKWRTFGVTIEGAGKDHASAGGSYDVALQIAKDVFKIKQPLQFGYEFFLVDGKKMSSSKGIGLTGEDLLELLDPRVLKFLMIYRDPAQSVEFNPRNRDIIPRLYDDYQKAADLFFTKSEEDLGRAFELSQIGAPEKPPTIRFSTLTQWVQMPNMEEEIKKANAERWAKHAKAWIEKYAPESEKFLVQDKLPEEAKKINDIQKQYLKKVSELISEDEDAETFQTKIYEAARDLGVPPKEAFSAIYEVFIGKDHGPKAAFLLKSLDKEFVLGRIRQATS